MTSGHLDATRLAEHAEGLLERDDALAADAHLQQCESCRASAADLASVTAMLAAAPRTVPMPEHVASRLDRAIASEATPEQEPAPAVQLSWFRRRAPQLLAAAATVGVLGFAGWVVGTGSGGDDAGEADAGLVTDSGERDADDAAAGEEPAEDSAEMEDAQEESAAESAATPLDAEDGDLYAASPALADEIRAVVEQQRTASDDDTCGQPLADELNVPLIGTAATHITGEPAVLVVVEGQDPDLVHGWVLPGCDATMEDALADSTVEID